MGRGGECGEGVGGGVGRLGHANSWLELHPSDSQHTHAQLVMCCPGLRDCSSFTASSSMTGVKARTSNL